MLVVLQLMIVVARVPRDLVIMIIMLTVLGTVMTVVKILWVRKVIIMVTMMEK